MFGLPTDGTADLEALETDDNVSDVDDSTDDTSDDTSDVTDDDESDDDESDADSADDDVDEDEDEAEGEDEDEDEGAEPAHKRITVAALKAQFPDIFKTFPTLRDTIFRERAFAEVFPTVADATAAFERLSDYETVEASIQNGDASALLSSVKSRSTDSLLPFAKSILTSLYKDDRPVYDELVTPLFENLTRALYQDGKRSNNEQFANAALALSKFLWDTEDVATGQRTVTKTEPKPKDDAVATLQQKLFNNAYNTVASKIRRTLSSTVQESLPSKLTPWVKEQLTKEVISAVDNQIAADLVFKRRIQSLWRSAAQVEFNSGSLLKIKAAYLERAKAIAPSVQSKLLARAFPTKPTSLKPLKAKTAVIGKVPVSRATSSSPQRTKVDYSKLSDLDILS